MPAVERQTNSNSRPDYCGKDVLIGQQLIRQVLNPFTRLKESYPSGTSKTRPIRNQFRRWELRGICDLIQCQIWGLQLLRKTPNPAPKRDLRLRSCQTGLEIPRQIKNRKLLQQSPAGPANHPQFTRIVAEGHGKHTRLLQQIAIQVDCRNHIASIVNQRGEAVGRIELAKMRGAQSFKLAPLSSFCRLLFPSFPWSNGLKPGKIPQRR